MDSYALPSGKHSMYKCDLKFSAQETISPIYLFNHLFILVQTHISVVIQYCYLIFSKLFQLWPFEALSVAPISFWHALIRMCVCEYAFLLSSATRYSTLILHILCCNPRISHFKEPWAPFI